MEPLSQNSLIEQQSGLGSASSLENLSVPSLSDSNESVSEIIDDYFDSNSGRGNNSSTSSVNEDDVNASSSDMEVDPVYLDNCSISSLSPSIQSFSSHMEDIDDFYMDHISTSSSRYTSASNDDATDISTTDNEDLEDVHPINVRAEWVDEPIYDDATVNKGEALFRILKLYVENKLTKKALSDVLETIDFHLPNGHLIPKTKYMLLKAIDELLPQSTKDVVTKHRICSECCKYLGKWLELTETECIRCNSNNVNSFFLEYSIEALIKDAFEVRNLHKLIDEYRAECENQEPDKLYDVTSGSEYKRLKLVAIPQQYDLFMIWFTDGAQTTRGSSGSTLWTIFIQIVNIDPRHRRSFQFVCGLYYTNRINRKPDMNSFLLPFATALETIFTKCVEWYHPTLHRTISSKAIAPFASLDAPAKASADNTMQFNGEYGCTSCEHRGETSEIGSGSNRVFPILLKDPPLRTDACMKKQTEIVEKYEDLYHFKGVKGKCVVSKIPYFDRVKGFLPDYMHAILLGVLRMHLKLWCLSQNHQADYYLNPRVRAAIDKDLKVIFPPDNVTRTPETLQQLKNWKASHFRAFLSYGPVLLRGRLAKPYYEHFLLLVKAVYILSKNEISQSELDIAETLMYIFVLDMEQLYGRNKCSYNVHQLLHMTQYVRMWGPLWAWSAFASEDGNGDLLRLAHGPNKLDVELFNTIKIINAYKAIRALIGADITRRKEPELLGPPSSHKLLKSEVIALRRMKSFTNGELQSIEIFARCKINNDNYTSQLYTRQKKRLNSCVSCKDKRIVGMIKMFLKIDGEIFCMLRLLVKSHDQTLQIKHSETGTTFSDMIIPIRETYSLLVIRVEEIETKVIRIKNYISHLPNDFERK